MTREEAAQIVRQINKSDDDMLGGDENDLLEAISAATEGRLT